MSTYSVALALHIIAVLVAYGLPLAYPVMLPWVRRHHPRAMPGVHASQLRLNRLLTGPGTLLVLALGVYLTAERDVFSEPWVHTGFAAILVIGAVGGWVVGASRRMAELAGADVERSGPNGPVTWSDEYERLFGRWLRVEILLGLVVLATVFAMAAKPGS